MKWIRLKQIDKLLFKEFVPPFLMAFLIAMFVLMMQFLWLYIDDIAGKGIGLLVLAEMIYYMGLSLIPMALPIAILLASVMVYGNLAEKYELASLKTAGIPLMRVMRSSMILSALVALSSYLCSDFVIPYANLKFRSRLYDIKKQKPALYLESGVFNDDFQGYSIRIGRKHADNRTIEDVMIDDDQMNNRSLFNIIRAKSGQMYVTEDERYFIMHLNEGHQYQKNRPTTARNDYPFIRTSFREWTKTFDLGEFDLERTDENLFKSYHAMLSTKQLSDGIDSIQRRLVDLRYEILNDLQTKTNYLYYEGQANRDSIIETENTAQSLLKPQLTSKPFLNTKKNDKASDIKDRRWATKQAKLHQLNQGKIKNITVDQPYLENLTDAESILMTFSTSTRASYLDNLRNIVRNTKNENYEFRRKRVAEEERLRRHRYQLHSKYGFAMVCFIFLFIGAPMGAIVRKGGFGYPLLVAIFFFMFFVILTKLFDKLSRSGSLDAALAAWLPCVILFPLGLFLTIKAMNDSKVLDVDRFILWISKQLNRGKSQEQVIQN